MTAISRSAIQRKSQTGEKTTFNTNFSIICTRLNPCTRPNPHPLKIPSFLLKIILESITSSKGIKIIFSQDKMHRNLETIWHIHDHWLPMKKTFLEVDSHFAIPKLLVEIGWSRNWSWNRSWSSSRFWSSKWFLDTGSFGTLSLFPVNTFAHIQQVTHQHWTNSSMFLPLNTQESQQEHRFLYNSPVP